VKCPHCNEEIEMGQMSAGSEPRTAEDIRDAQSRARLDDANESTRREVTVEEIRKLRVL
jgi:hypothetical protein